MRRTFCAWLALVLMLSCTACAPKQYSPAGDPTGDAALDEQVLSVLQQTCQAKNSLTDNVRAVYDWVANEIQYRASTADTSNGFTDDVTAQLASELLAKRRGACDGEAALMAVLLRRMGCEAQIVQGTFLRADDPEPVDHAWVYAVVNGTDCWFDPLYGGHFAENPRDYFMADDSRMALTHQWDAAAD